MSTISKNYAANFKNRLVEAMGDESAHSVAKRAEISYTAFRGYLDGSVPGADKADQLARALNVSVAWLVSGEGEKMTGLSSKNQSSYAQMPNFNNDLKPITPDIVQQTVSALYRHLEEKKQVMDAESIGEVAAILAEWAAEAGGFNHALIERLMRLKSR